MTRLAVALAAALLLTLVGWRRTAKDRDRHATALRYARWVERNRASGDWLGKFFSVEKQMAERNN